LNGLQSLDQWQDYYGRPTGAVLGALSNAYTLGNFAALPVISHINDKWGRLMGLRVGCLIAIVGSALQGASQHYAMFLIARFIIGFGSVIALVGGPTLVSELAYPTHRGVATALFGPSWYTGAFIAAWVTYGTYSLQNSWAWRLPSLLQGLIPLIQVGLSYFIPESPRYLINNGREEEARAILMKYHGGDDPANNDLIEFEMNEIKITSAAEKASKEVSYKAFFATKANRHRLFVCVFLACTSQLAGNGLVSYYLNLILNSIGITESRRQLLINGALMAYNIGTAVFAGFMCGKIPRRLNLLLGVGGMLVFYIIWTALSAINQQRNFENEALGEGVLAMIFLYYFAYNFRLAQHTLPQEKLLTHLQFECFA
jgi:MFS family permease